MPENAHEDQLTRRMTARLTATADPCERLAVAIDFLRAAAKRASRTRATEGPALVSDLLVVFVAAQVWEAASLIGRAQVAAADPGEAA